MEQGLHKEHLLRLEKDTSFEIIKITKLQAGFLKSTYFHKI